MPTQCIDIPGEESEIPESSQINAANPVIETPTPSSPPQPQRKEYRDSEGEDQSVTDRASDVDDHLDEDFVPKKSRVTYSRVLRSHKSKQESINSELPISNHNLTSDVGKRGREDHETEVMPPAKRGRKPAASTDKKKFEKYAAAMVEEYNFKVDDLENIRTKNQELQLQVKSLKKEHKQGQQDHRQREISQNKEIASLKSECNVWRRKLAIALDDAKQDSDKYVKVSDSDIAGDWQKLSFNIRDLVSQCLTKETTDECDELETLMDWLKRYLPLSLCEISSLRVAVLRRTIWHIIILGVFSGERAIWHGEVGQMLTQFLSEKNLNHLKDPHYLKIVSQMKFRVIAGLNEKTQFNKRAMDKLIDRAIFHLYDFISEPLMDHFQDQMKKLIVEAMCLHTVMMKSKAIFLLRWIGDDDGIELSPYKSDSMESMQNGMDADAFNHIVEFVEAPALVKYGNADGEGFQHSMILCKASVILGVQKVTPTLKVEISSRATSHDSSSEELDNTTSKSRYMSE